MWTERGIAAHLVRQTFQRKFLVVPNCYWTGHECDLLVVTPRLMVIDVEIKCTRADLRADAAKQKWWYTPLFFSNCGEPRPAKQARDWPPRVWRHYYCAPTEIWQPEMLGDLLTTANGDRALLAPQSGVILVREDERGQIVSDVVRRARSNPDAKPITAEQAIDIARLANLRMWDALTELDRLRAAGQNTPEEA